MAENYHSFYTETATCSKSVYGVEDEKEEMFINMQYYMEYCQIHGYVTPQEWIKKQKHFK